MTAASARAAVVLLDEARAAGVVLRVGDDGGLRARGAPLALLGRLRERKAELAELLRGERCRWCGQTMAWPGPAGVMEATGTALHHACYAAEDATRLKRLAENALSPEALADPAELTIRGEFQPEQERAACRP